MSATEDLAEADRLMRICNACRYCEGLCAVFPAMEMRRSFAEGDLNYLANLCHQCGACYFDCQYAPPHEFNVNVPQILAKVRAGSYRSYAWPQAFAPLFERNGLAIATIAAVSVAAFIIGFMAWVDSDVLFGVHRGEGAFYAIMPHNAMLALFGTASLYAIVALYMGFRAFWKDIGASGERLDGQSIWQAISDAGKLRYLDGGGVGCMNEDEKPTDKRKYYHHATFYGFLLCLASTSTATLYHYLFGWEAPYSWYSLPVVLGTAGGIGLLAGPAGLLVQKWKRDPDMSDVSRYGMDVAFLAMLFLVSFSGLLLLVMRDSAAMGTLLAIHLGFVFAFFLTMPYGKFVHGLYRFGALVRYAIERRQGRIYGAAE